jgi:predicted transcriptional regulator
MVIRLKRTVMPKEMDDLVTDFTERLRNAGMPSPSKCKSMQLLAELNKNMFLNKLDIKIMKNNMKKKPLEVNIKWNP